MTVVTAGAGAGLLSDVLGIGAESFSLSGNAVYLSEKFLSELQISLVSRSTKKLNIPQNISNMETS